MSYSFGLFLRAIPFYITLLSVVGEGGEKRIVDGGEVREID